MHLLPIQPTEIYKSRLQIPPQTLKNFMEMVDNDSLKTAVIEKFKWPGHNCFPDFCTEMLEDNFMKRHLSDLLIISCNK